MPRSGVAALDDRCRSHCCCIKWTSCLLGGVEAKLVGMMLGVSGARDPVDGHIALLARERTWPDLTSDPADLLAIDPSLEIIVA